MISTNLVGGKHHPSKYGEQTFFLLHTTMDKVDAQEQTADVLRFALLFVVILNVNSSRLEISKIQTTNKKNKAGA